MAAFLCQTEAVVRGMGYSAVACAAATACFVVDVGARTRFAIDVALPLEDTSKIERDCPTCPSLAAIHGGDVTVAADAGGMVTHRVWPGFVVSRREISEVEFAAFVRATGHRRQPCAATSHDRAACVTRADAEAYIVWLTRMSGRRYRLMTAVEWAHAAKTAGQNKVTGMHDGVAEIVDDCEDACRAAVDQRYTVIGGAPDGSTGFRVVRMFDLSL